MGAAWPGLERCNQASVLKGPGEAPQPAGPRHGVPALSRSRAPARPPPHGPRGRSDPSLGTPGRGPQTTQPVEVRPEWPWNDLCPGGNFSWKVAPTLLPYLGAGPPAAAVHSLSGRKNLLTPLGTNFHPVRLLTPKECSGGKHVSTRTKGREEESD